MGNIYNITFSPTGGTKKAADILVKEAWDAAKEIDLTDRNTDFSSYSFEKEDVCVVSVPSYGGRVPGLAIERLQQMKGNGARAVLAVVYGNRHYDDTFLELGDVLEAAGFVLVAAVAALAEHSIVRSLAAGRPDAQDAEELKGFAKKIRVLTDNTQNLEKLQLPGNRPYKEFGGGMKPETSEDCRACGACAKVCPAGAIPEEHPEQTESDKCISCMRCIAVCPAGARKLNTEMLAGITERLTQMCSERRGNELFVAEVKA